MTDPRRELAALRLQQRRLVGIALAGRDATHSVYDNLAAVHTVREPMTLHPDATETLSELVREAQRHLAAAGAHVQALQRVTRVKTWDTPFGPALDLVRSAEG